MPLAASNMHLGHRVGGCMQDRLLFWGPQRMLMALEFEARDENHWLGEIPSGGGLLGCLLGTEIPGHVLGH